jgi:replicative DNA helicase
MELGMVSEAQTPPQNLDAEEHVLGAMLLSPHAITAVADEVRPDEFYRGTHGLIFQTALDVDARGEPVDAITLVSELERTGRLEQVGGKVRIHELAALVPATANAAQYARIVREMARRRALIAAGQEVTRLGWEGIGTSDELIDAAEQAMSAVSSTTYDGEFESMSASLTDLYSQIEKAVQTHTPIHGLMTGFHDFDDLTTGLYGGQLLIIAARPGVGKSVLTQNILENVADANIPAALFTLEMSKREVALRSVVRQTRLPLNRLRTGRLSSTDLQTFKQTLTALQRRPLFIEDKPGVSMTELRARARRLKAKHGLGLVAVDYLQLMLAGGSTESRQVEVANISRSLKMLAMDLDIPVIAVSQLSRKTEAREDRRPVLSDLRDSGAIEQDADLVAFIYREETYKQVDADRAGEAELIVAKNRMGAQDTKRLLFLGHRQTFANPARIPQTGGPE